MNNIEMWRELGDIQTTISGLIRKRDRLMYALARKVPLLEVKVFVKNKQQVRVMRRVGKWNQEVFFWDFGDNDNPSGFYHCEFSSAKVIPPGERSMHLVIPLSTSDRDWEWLVHAMLKNPGIQHYYLDYQERKAV